MQDEHEPDEDREDRRRRVAAAEQALEQVHHGVPADRGDRQHEQRKAEAAESIGGAADHEQLEHDRVEAESRR